MEYDAIVVGAAVAGSRTAELLAKQGKKILLLEDSAEVGKPCKCTGLVSWRIKENLPNLPKEVVVNVLSSAKFFSPSGFNFELQSKKPVYLLDRPGFDKFLFEEAIKAGAEARVGERFLSYKIEQDFLIVETDKATYTTSLLIGADGANSTVGRQAGLKYPEKFLVGVQTTAEGDFDSVELWFGSDISPKFFAWVAPESPTRARIGLATNPGASEYYQKFLQKRIGKVLPPDVGGIIRAGLMEETAAEHVMVVGDAACQIKPYTGGGILYGLIAAQFCADTALKAIQAKRFNKSFLMENYDKAWKKVLAKAINRGMFIYNFLTANDKIVDTLFLTGKISRGILNNLDMDLVNIFV